MPRAACHWLVAVKKSKRQRLYGRAAGSGTAKVTERYGEGKLPYHRISAERVDSRSAGLVWRHGDIDKEALRCAAVGCRKHSSQHPAPVSSTRCCPLSAGWEEACHSLDRQSDRPQSLPIPLPTEVKAASLRRHLPDRPASRRVHQQASISYLISHTLSQSMRQ
jgi:hypothetical protein